MGVAGLAAGLPLALPAARVAQALLFRTRPSDPLTLGAGVLLFTCTLAASYARRENDAHGPGRRAASAFGAPAFPGCSTPVRNDYKS